ncbi:sulfite exporter TauE/SafE family protein [Acanthopleuribacter pedis]|nr:sulfite exporter TauE/SafE family protein [Acanthopleuribacter pedis]
MVLLVVLAGLACGFINVLAGSGSLISLPILIFMGLDAKVANGTNRVAILCQNIVGVGGYYRQGVLDTRHGPRLMVPAVVGALLGAKLAVELDENLMRLVISLVMFLMLGVILVKPKRWLEGAVAPQREGFRLGEVLVFFAIGVYGGFIQAGVGVFLLAGLVLQSGYDLVKANAVKLLIVLGYTPFALAIFIWEGQVDWTYGLLLACGNMLGAWLGTKVAVSWGPAFVRWVLIAVVAVSAVRMLGLSLGWF